MGEGQLTGGRGPLERVPLAPTANDFFITAWITATANKCISLMYFTYGYLAGIVGFSLSVLTRLEMNSPLPYIIAYAKSHVFNCITTLHGIIMIFYSSCQHS